MDLDARVDLDAAADELYGADPAEFVGLRNTLAKQARGQGNSDLASAITALRKPTRVGWVLNRFARSEPDDVAALLDLAGQLRDAQRSGAADRLRELASDRTRAVAAARTAVVATAAQHDVPLSQNAIRQIDHTLRAALADPDVAEQLRTGRMVGAVEYSGFGPPTLVAVGAVETSESDSGLGEEAAGTADKDDDLDDGGAALAETRRLLTEATADLESAAAAADEAGAQLTRAVDRCDALERRRDELRRELAAVEDESRFTRRQVHAAQTERDAAAQAVDEARSRVHTLRTTLEAYE